MGLGRSLWITGISLFSTLCTMSVAHAQQGLFLAYPPDRYETTADRIFLIGTAPPDQMVTVNGEPIGDRSPAGHFAPSVPLQMGENRLVLRAGAQERVVVVTRLSVAPPEPVGVAFATDSLLPAVDIARSVGEVTCFGAIAPVQATVSAELGNQVIPLLPDPEVVELPPNSAVLTLQNQPVERSQSTQYRGCAMFSTPGNLGYPQFRLSLDGQTVVQTGTGQVSILSPTQFQIVTVTAPSGTARTGPSTDYSRLTPLPTGTQAAITGREGDWYRLDYGAWIAASQVQVSNAPVPPRSLIRSVRSQSRVGWTEIRFPLQVPVPVSVQQGDRTFTLTLHNTTAQTDTILFNDDPLVARIDWTQPAPNQVQYTFSLKPEQQWGYTLAYEGTTLVLSLRHPPELPSPTAAEPLRGVTILLDPGHGSENDLGARGPTGYPEKDVNLVVSRLIRDRLLERGATVYMTREGDDDLFPQDRVDQINALQPTIALSIHYNALPDAGDALNTAGIGMFWYNPQAHSLSVFLQEYLTETLDRPSYGVFWNSLALTRPTVAPSVLLELGFMINPYEFEWIVDPVEQERLAEAIAAGVTQWLQESTELTGD